MIDIIINKFRESIKTYSYKFTKNDDFVKFIKYYNSSNIYDSFPFPIKFELPNIDDEFARVNIENIDQTKINEKNNEFIKSSELLNGKNIRKIRRFFSYEIKDYISRILPNSYVTNAWLKMYELLCVFKPLNNIKNINAFHICEHPGSFIYAINDFMKLKNINIPHNFWFQSLKPNEHNNTIFKGERYLLKKYDKNLDYGATGTGDITSTKNIEYYINNYKKNKINFITSDCGLDESDDFSLQEINLVKIFFSAALIAFGLLENRGSYVSKLFTFYNKKTQELIYLCSKYFKKVNLVKLLTTKSNSNEIYLICEDFNGCDELDKLIKYHENYDDNMFVTKISSFYFDRLKICNCNFEMLKIISSNQFIFSFNNIEFINENPSIHNYILNLVSYYKKYFLTFLDFYNSSFMFDINKLIYSGTKSSSIDIFNNNANDEMPVDTYIYKNFIKYTLDDIIGLFKLRKAFIKITKNNIDVTANIDFIDDNFVQMGGRYTNMIEKTFKQNLLYATKSKYQIYNSYNLQISFRKDYIFSQIFDIFYNYNLKTSYLFNVFCYTNTLYSHPFIFKYFEKINYFVNADNSAVFCNYNNCDDNMYHKNIIEVLNKVVNNTNKSLFISIITSSCDDNFIKIVIDIINNVCFFNNIFVSFNKYSFPISDINIICYDKCDSKMNIDVVRIDETLHVLLNIFTDQYCRAIDVMYILESNKYINNEFYNVVKTRLSIEKKKYEFVFEKKIKNHLLKNKK